jgi:metallo-beta-lactamase family protein
MEVTFHGAAREVTGSLHMLSCKEDKILLDCGMFQGRRKESNDKNRSFSFDPKTITNVVLSHAHIDHCGRIPLLIKQGFTGRIISTRATEHICKHLLLDSAKIQESDADYLNYKTARIYLQKNKDNKSIKSLKPRGHTLNTKLINKIIENNELEIIEPLYSTEEALNSLSYIEGYPYKTEAQIGKDIFCKLYDAGHVLGSSLCLIKAKEKNGQVKNICFTGDLGRFGRPILKDPQLIFEKEETKIDLLIIESTYGNRFHEGSDNTKEKLKKALNETYARGGSVLIPSFAFGRTQEIIYVLHELYDEGSVPRIPIFVDSPLGTRLTKVFGEHMELYDKETHRTFLENKKNPFLFPEINFTSSVEESIALVKEKNPHIVISSSGMCEAGRVLHHLRYKIHNERNMILIVGYMAANTLGRRLQEKAKEFEENNRKGEPPLLKFLNKTYPLLAHVVTLSGFSAHADQNELIKFVENSNINIKNIAVVHGEEKQILDFCNLLNKKGYSAKAPKMGESIKV